MRITVGTRWSLFTYAREDMELLGTVQRGMQIGALARLPDGSYAQVNGDIMEPLNASRVVFALRAAGGSTHAGFVLAAPTKPATPVTVTVKKRRRIVVQD